MVVNNRTLEILGTRGIRGGSDTYPTHIFFAGSGNTYTGSEITVSNDYFRTSLVWSKVGIDSKFVSTLNNNDAIGSYIYTVGFGENATLNHGSVYFAFPSAIGSKSNAFSVEIEGNFVIRRPIL